MLYLSGLVVSGCVEPCCMASCGIAAIVAVLIYAYLLAYILPASLIQPGQRHRHIPAFPVAALLAYLNGVEYMLSHFLVWLDQLPLLPARRFCSLPHCRKGVPKSAKLFSSGVLAVFQSGLCCLYLALPLPRYQAPPVPGRSVARQRPYVFSIRYQRIRYQRISRAFLVLFLCLHCTLHRACIVFCVFLLFFGPDKSGGLSCFQLFPCALLRGFLPQRLGPYPRRVQVLHWPALYSADSGVSSLLPVCISLLRSRIAV